MSLHTELQFSAFHSLSCAFLIKYMYLHLFSYIAVISGILPETCFTLARIQSKCDAGKLTDFLSTLNSHILYGWFAKIACLRMFHQIYLRDFSSLLVTTGQLCSSLQRDSFMIYYIKFEFFYIGDVNSLACVVFCDEKIRFCCFFALYSNGLKKQRTVCTVHTANLQPVIISQHRNQKKEQLRTRCPWKIMHWLRR